MLALKLKRWTLSGGLVRQLSEMGLDQWQETSRRAVYVFVIGFCLAHEFLKGIWDLLMELFSEFLEELLNSLGPGLKEERPTLTTRGLNVEHILPVLWGPRL